MPNSINSITALQADINGSIWIGADSALVNNLIYSGLYMYSQGNIKSVNEIYPACYNSYLPKNIHSLGITKKGYILAAGTSGSGFSEYAGIVEFRESEFHIYFLPESVFGDIKRLQKTHLTVDGNDNIWFIDRLNPSLYNLQPQSHVAYYKSIYAADNVKFLDVNNVSAPISNRGDMFWDYFSTAKYEVPKGSCKNSLFASALWIGGLDSIGNLHAAAMTYRQQIAYDYFPGPLDTIQASTNPATMNAYDRVWKINRLTIEKFIDKFQDGSVTNGSYIIPDEILTWPAHGSGNYSSKLAPFVDVNNDGLYNPYDGDYPKIKGDQMIYSIFNDNGYNHTETEALAMGIEVHASAYAFACSDYNGTNADSVINYTTFFNYRIINRSNIGYDSTYIGLWADVDLGNRFDDYMGSYPAKDAAYVYNGSNYDSGWTGYGHNPPMINYMILKGPEYAPGQFRGMQYARTYNNDFTVTGNPSEPIHYYWYLTARWKNGDPITYGDQGFGGSQQTAYMYPDFPNDTTGWSEVTAGNPAGDNSRFLISSGPFKLPSKGETSIDYAIVHTGVPNAVNYYPELFAANDKALDKVKSWYENNNFPSCLVATGIPERDKRWGLSVYPNPTGASIVINYAPSSRYAEYEIFSMNGQIVKRGRLGEKVTEENLSGLSAGVYIIKVLDGQKLLYGKVVKQ